MTLKGETSRAGAAVEGKGVVELADRGGEGLFMMSQNYSKRRAPSRGTLCTKL